MAQSKKLNKELNDDKEFRNDTFKKIPKIFKLNDDCMLHIFSFLTIKERLRIKIVCKKWQALINLPWNDIKKLEISFSLESHDQNIKFTLPILRKVLQHCGTSLTNVTLTGYQGMGLNKNVIVLLTKKCSNIRSLDTTYLYITRKMMESIAGFRGLTHFAIGQCWHDCEEEVSRIFSANKNLRSVEFQECARLNGNCLSTLPTNAIESIGFGQNCGLDTDVVCKLMSKLKNLRTLIVGNARLTDSLNKLLEMLPVKSNLKEIRFPRSSFSDLGSPHNNHIRALYLFTNLQKLTLIGGTTLDDEQLRIIGQHCRGLIYASLRHSQRVTDSGMRDFVKLLNLEELEIAHLSRITNTSLAFINMPSLKIFSCSDCALLNYTGFYMLMLGATNLEQLKLYSQLVYVSIDALIILAKGYIENRNTDKVLKIIYTSETSSPRIYKVSTHLMVEIRTFPSLPRLKPLAVSSTSSDSSSSSDSLPEDDSSSTSSSSYSPAHLSSSPSISEENPTGNSSPAESEALSNNCTSSNPSSRNSSPTGFSLNSSPSSTEQSADTSSEFSLPMNSPPSSFYNNSTYETLSPGHSSCSSSSLDSDSS